MSQPVVFPYKIYKDSPCPIIKFSVSAHKDWIDVEAYVDSGASVSLFSVLEAQRLGLDFTKGRRIYFRMGDGGLIPVYLHKLMINVGDVLFKASVGFSKQLGVGFNLIGREDFFTQFDITFSDATKSITFSPRT